MAFLLRFPFAVIALGAMTACTGTITVEGDDPEDDPGDTAIPCPPDAEPSADPLVITNVRSASFMGDRLHIDADVDGAARYLVLDLLDAATAEAIDLPEPFEGPARFQPIASDYFARLRVDDGGAAHVDVIYRGANGPAHVSSLDLKGIVDMPTAFSVSDLRAFFCMRPTPESERELYAVDLTDLAKPAEPALIETFQCNLYDDLRVAAEGPAWIVTNIPTGFYVQGVDVYHVGEEGAENAMSYGYNQTGVHAYGNALFTAVSPTRGVVDPENPSLFLTIDTSATPNGVFDWVDLSVSSERSLLGVVDETAYLTTPEGVRAYDITDIHAPALTDYIAEVTFTFGAPRLVASSEKTLVIADGPDRLYVAPREAPGALVPLRVFEHGEAPTTACP